MDCLHQRFLPIRSPSYGPLHYPLRPTCERGRTVILFLSLTHFPPHNPSSSVHVEGNGGTRPSWWIFQFLYFKSDTVMYYSFTLF